MQASNSIEVEFYKHPIYNQYAADINGNIYSLKWGKIKLLNPYEDKIGRLVFNVYNYGKQNYIRFTDLYTSVSISN